MTESPLSEILERVRSLITTWCDANRRARELNDEILELSADSMKSALSRPLEPPSEVREALIELAVQDPAKFVNGSIEKPAVDPTTEQLAELERETRRLLEAAAATEVPLQAEVDQLAARPDVDREALYERLREMLLQAGLDETEATANALLLLRNPVAEHREIERYEAAARFPSDAAPPEGDSEAHPSDGDGLDHFDERGKFLGRW